MSQLVEIQDVEFDDATGFISGTGVFDVDTEYEPGDGTVVSYCEFQGLLIGGAMIKPDLLASMFGSTAVEATRIAALEQFQSEIDAGDWRDAA